MMDNCNALDTLLPTTYYYPTHLLHLILLPLLLIVLALNIFVVHPILAKYHSHPINLYCTLANRLTMIIHKCFHHE